MPSNIKVSVQVFQLGPKKNRQHSALQFKPLNRQPVSVEAVHTRRFQCALCNDNEWHLQPDMKNHFESNHADQQCLEHQDAERFLRGTFRTKNVFGLHQFLDDDTICSGATINYVKKLGELPATFDTVSLWNQWEANLKTQQYDPIANNCNHQVEKWCKDLGMKQPPLSVNFLASLANQLFGSMYG